MIPLGSAIVIAQLSRSRRLEHMPSLPNIDPNDYYGWTKVLFILKQNYLFEYSAEIDNLHGKPRGYAHLQYSTVTPHPQFTNAFELAFIDDEDRDTKLANNETNFLQRAKKTVSLFPFFKTLFLKFFLNPL